MKLNMLFAPALLALALTVTPAGAFVPQTITVDGTNDFDPANLIDADGGDTEIKNWCTNDPDLDAPMDLKDIYITNDNSYLYIGFFYDKDCFSSPQVNLGLAIDTGTGGTPTDPFGRKIGWAQCKAAEDTTVAVLPDYVVYDVLDAYNYEVIYETASAGTAWANVSTEVNPGWGGGSNGLGIVEGPPFVEYRIPLSVLNFTRAGGPIAGDVLHVEWWMTQDGTTKPPLDLAASDTRQKSTVASTTFDVATVVQVNRMLRYQIQAITDNTPPTTLSALAVGFPVLPNKQFGLTTNKIDVSFSEPVELASSQVVGNYSIPGAPPVTGAVRDVAATNVVHLTLASGIGASASFRDVTVTGVKDLVGNTIVNNGTTNKSSFFIQAVKFQAGAQVGLCAGFFAAADTFAVEGSLLPLTFGLCDNALATDANADSVYEVTVPFCMAKDTGTGKAEADLQWKFSHKCVDYESGANRNYHLSSDNGATPTVFVYWNNDDPINFTKKAIDVIFKVDATLLGPGTITLLGSQAPLSFTQPGLGMTPIGGNIYQATVRFPKCTAKTVNWKVDRDGVIECLGQGDRNVYLNDALFGIVGSPEGPITLPARGIDRCTVTDKAVKVVFKVDMRIVTPNLTAADTVAVFGDRAPLSFAAPPPAAARMLDDGAGFDATANDQKFAVAVTFPDSTDLNLNFKYWYNSKFECIGVGDRYMAIDDVTYSVANPQIRVMNFWDYCSDLVGVPDGGGPRPAEATWARLRQNTPNPFNPTTRIGFELKSGGAVALTIFDVTGRKVRDLVQGDLSVGDHEFLWDGTDNDGRAVSSGMYFYQLSQAGQRLVKRMVIIQ